MQVMWWTALCSCGCSGAQKQQQQQQQKQPTSHTNTRRHHQQEQYMAAQLPPLRCCTAWLTGWQVQYSRCICSCCCQSHSTQQASLF
jgi:hypothetical protein